MVTPTRKAVSGCSMWSPSRVMATSGPDRSRRRPSATTRARGALLALLALPLAGCAKGVLDPAGPVAADEKVILFNSLAIMLAIVIPTIILTLAFAWWYRASNTKAEYKPDFAYSGRVELIVWSAPILIILFLAGVIWIGSHRLDPFRPLPTAPGQKAVEVQVVSLDWKWLFIYPEQGVASVNRLVIPAGTPVHFSLTSSSVMNSFFVPQLGTMIYTMNGMVTQLNLKADKPGAYYGQSTHFSGDGFSDMEFTVNAVPTDQFGAWVAKTKAAAGPQLDVATYRKFAQQSTDVKPFTFRAVDNRIFGAIAAQKLPPSPGPQEGERGGPHVSPGDNS
jgi:cytochrome o ubiquinol oxidase subunit II